MSMSGTRQTINQGPYQQVPRTFNRGTVPDTHDWQNTALRKQNGADAQPYNMAGITLSSSTTTVPGAGINDVYLYFDSSRTTGSALANGSITFSIPQINNGNSVSQVIGMRMYPFYFPRLLHNPTFTAMAQPDPWLFRRGFVRVQPVGVTGVLAPGSSTHHFEFDIGLQSTLNNLAVDWQPIAKEGEGGVFYFRKPLNELTDITFQFLRPIFTTTTNTLTPIVIPPPTVSVVNAGNTLPAQFTITTPGVTVWTFFSLVPQVTPYVLAAPGLPVLGADFASPITAVNNAVNSQDGMFVTTFVDDTTFTVTGAAGLDFTAIGPGPWTAQLMYAGNRIAFRMQFICVENSPTNFISIQHA